MVKGTVLFNLENQQKKSGRNDSSWITAILHLLYKIQNAVKTHILFCLYISNHFQYKWYQSFPFRRNFNDWGILRSLKYARHKYNSMASKQDVKTLVSYKNIRSLHKAEETGLLIWVFPKNTISPFPHFVSVPISWSFDCQGSWKCFYTYLHKFRYLFT